VAAGGPEAARVWDPVVRVLHWCLAASIAAAWLTRHSGGGWHERIGYATLAIVALRLIWGWVGPRHARFSQFVRGPSATWRYALAMLAHREPRHVGHNPLGGWMIVALLLTAALAAGSGWLYTTDEFWGIAWVEQLHEALAIFILVLVALHVLGVIAASVRHRENLAAAMIHGRKRPAQGEDVG
jgi:cytochrome b